MDGQLRNYRQTNYNDKCIIPLQNYCRFSLSLLKIPVISKPLCLPDNCHNNVNHYVNTYGGEKISGYYLITDVLDNTCGAAIYHSVWKNTFGDIIDITPYKDNREYNMFSIMNENDYYSGVLYDGKEFELMSIGLNNIL